VNLPVKQPYSRDDFAGALIANAAAKPFNIALLVGTMGAAVVVGGTVIVALVVALVIYAIAVARTFFDEEEADAVLQRVRGERRSQLSSGTKHLDPSTLAPEIRRHLLDARATDARIREAIERAELPYAEVSTEVDALVSLMELSASRAQLLWEALEESPPSRVAARLRELDGSGKTELIEALQHQLTVQQKMQAQLQSFYDQMERIVVELDSIRGSLLSVSASTDAANQQRLAGDVRALRDELGTLAEGMSEAFEDRAA
jgi:Ni2+-binding GTPase involved in maturation of urease and hydrogenase